MAKDPRVLNQTTGFRLKFSQARKAVEDCNCAWVVVGESVRSLSLAEQRAALAKREKDREPLPYSEIHGLKFEAPTGAAGAYRQSRLLAYEAVLFVEETAAQGVSAQ